MKRILLALALLALVIPAAQKVRAEDEVTIDFFYNNLNDGDWVEVGDYGYCWQPNVVSNSNWRPYADGYWAYTDVGWTWVSNEDFGWATYHYGRWVRLEDRGWIWVPGYEWGPAWVSWRTGGDYVGWAPLPPTRERVYEGRAITGHVDVEFDIGPLYYNFVDVRYVGEPRLIDRIYPPTQNITVIEQTVNVTNITYTNSVVYNYGPDYNTLNQYSTQPIRRLKLERATNVNLSAGARPSEFVKVEADKLVLAAPLKVKPVKNAAPKVVKAKIVQAKVEHGWSGIPDPKLKEKLVQKMKTEDSKNIPPPKIAPARKADAAAAASPAIGASPATGTSPAASATPITRATPVTSVTPGRGATATPATSVAPSATPAMSPEKSRQKGKRGEPKATPPTTASPAEHGQRTPPERERGRHPKQSEEAAPTPSGATQSELERGAADQRNLQERGKGRKGRQSEEPGATPKPETPNALEHDNAAGPAPEGQPPVRQKGGRGRGERAPTPSEPGATPNESGQGRDEGRNELAPADQSRNAEAPKERRKAPEGRVQGQEPGGAPAGEGKKEGGQHKKKGGEASPTPGAP